MRLAPDVALEAAHGTFKDGMHAPRNDKVSQGTTWQMLEPETVASCLAQRIQVQLVLGVAEKVGRGRCTPTHLQAPSENANNQAWGIKHTDFTTTPRP